MKVLITGQIVEGKVTGIQPYGAFVSLYDNHTGLIHISEISDGYVKDISRFVEVGEIVKVKVIDFDTTTNQARLSLKALNHTFARSHRRPISRSKASLPENTIGFQSIAEMMPTWIKEAKEKNNHDEI